MKIRTVGQRRCRFGQVAIELRDQAGRAAAVYCNRLDNRYAEFFFQNVAIDTNVTLHRGITHIERKNHRQTEIPQFQHESQMQSEIGRVGNTDYGIGLLFTRKPAQTDIARYLFIRTGRSQAVGPGQIKHFQSAAGWRRQPARFTLYGNACIVSNFLTTTRQQVEQGSFSTVGISDEGNAQCRHGKWGLRAVR